MIHQLKLISKLLSFVYVIFSVFMLFCGFTALLYSEKVSMYAFLQTSVIVFIISALLYFFSRTKIKKQLNNRSGFILVVFLWVSICFVGAVPYYLSNSIPSFVDALFESVSGFTTTGSTILTDIEVLPKSIQVWRALTHWIGGGGIVVLSVAVLPLLGIGGSHLMKAETTGVTKEKLTPRIAETAKYLWILYIVLNIAGVFLLMAGGMNFLDAFTHGSSAIATGGFSNKNLSTAYYSSSYIEWVLIFFMYIGSLNFLVIIKAVKGELSTLWYDSELKVYTLIILLVSLGSALNIYFSTEGIKTIDGRVYSSIVDIIRISLFQTISVISTTGFSLSDYSIWPPASQILIFLLFFIGGSSGSTSGGVKVIRHIIMFKQAVLNIKTLIHPRGVFTMRLNNNPVSQNTVITVMGFIVVYMAVTFVCSFIVALSGSLTTFEALTAVLGSIGTYGPGFGAIGPAGNYGFLPDFAKITLLISMIIGRLELFTVFIIFTKWFWKK